MRARWAGSGEYAIVKVLARMGGRVMMELIYHDKGGKSRRVLADCQGTSPPTPFPAREGATRRTLVAERQGIAAMRGCDTAWW